jgi:hypothetical protein
MTTDLHAAMTTAELEAFRDMVALAESAVQLFTIMGGVASYLGAGRISITVAGLKTVTSGPYLMANMNTYLEGRRP